jgi:hypothetical protein
VLEIGSKKRVANSNLVCDPDVHSSISFATKALLAAAAAIVTDPRTKLESEAVRHLRGVGARARTRQRGKHRTEATEVTKGIGLVDQCVWVNTVGARARTRQRENIAHNSRRPQREFGVGGREPWLGHGRLGARIGVGDNSRSFKTSRTQAANAVSYRLKENRPAHKKAQRCPR